MIINSENKGRKMNNYFGGTEFICNFFKKFLYLLTNFSKGKISQGVVDKVLKEVSDD